MKKNTEIKVDWITLLSLEKKAPGEQEVLMREFRIRTIDKIIADINKTLNAEEKKALKHYLRMCPPIEKLVTHLRAEHPEFDTYLQTYLTKPPYTPKS